MSRLRNAVQHHQSVSSNRIFCQRQNLRVVQWTHLCTVHTFTQYIAFEVRPTGHGIAEEVLEMEAGVPFLSFHAQVWYMAVAAGRPTLGLQGLSFELGEVMLRNWLALHCPTAQSG